MCIVYEQVITLSIVLLTTQHGDLCIALGKKMWRPNTTAQKARFAPLVLSYSLYSWLLGSSIFIVPCYHLSIAWILQLFTWFLALHPLYCPLSKTSMKYRPSTMAFNYHIWESEPLYTWRVRHMLAPSLHKYSLIAFLQSWKRCVRWAVPTWVIQSFVNKMLKDVGTAVPKIICMQR